MTDAFTPDREHVRLAGAVFCTARGDAQRAPDRARMIAEALNALPAHREAATAPPGTQRMLERAMGERFPRGIPDHGMNLAAEFVFEWLGARGITVLTARQRAYALAAVEFVYDNEGGELPTGDSINEAELDSMRVQLGHTPKGDVL